MFRWAFTKGHISSNRRIGGTRLMEIDIVKWHLIYLTDPKRLTLKWTFRMDTDYIFSRKCSRFLRIFVILFGENWDSQSLAPILSHCEGSSAWTAMTRKRTAKMQMIVNLFIFEVIEVTTETTIDSATILTEINCTVILISQFTQTGTNSWISRIKDIIDDEFYRTLYYITYNMFSWEFVLEFQHSHIAIKGFHRLMKQRSE